MSSSYDREATPTRSQQYGHLTKTHIRATLVDMKSGKAILLDEELQVNNGCPHGESHSSSGKSPDGLSVPKGQS